MEHLAKSCGMDPLSFRMLNMSSGEEVILLRKIIEQVRASSEYDQRVKQIEEFNANNRWKKRGINLLPMVYPVDYAPFKYNVLVAIYHNGGAVAVSHGGIECGQGINTKVAQVVARELGVPISLISVKPTNTLTNANGSVTGGSMTSELNCYAAMRACQELNERIRPFKEKMPEADWKTLIETCFNMNVDLTARHYYSPADGVKNYIIHGATVSEVELDLLTGEKLIRRVDLLEDAGQSLNPLLDIGQAEGAFVMGIGLWTSEKIKYDPVTGQKLSVGTWNYKPPLNRDIPVDFRVSLLKNAAHPFGVLRSKATGEPPICMSVSVFFAIRNAVEAARKEAGDSDWFPMDGPATVDKLFKLFKTKADHFSIAQ
jgi:xanthine dehydrogenase/oxidase